MCISFHLFLSLFLHTRRRLFQSKDHISWVLAFMDGTMAFVYASEATEHNGSFMFTFWLHILLGYQRRVELPIRERTKPCLAIGGPFQLHALSSSFCCLFHESCIQHSANTSCVHFSRNGKQWGQLHSSSFSPRTRRSKQSFTFEGHDMPRESLPLDAAMYSSDVLSSGVERL